VGDLRTLLELRQAYPLSWSRDGTWLLVASDLSGTRQLYRLSLAGGELEQLTSYAEPVEGQLLPDDRLLLEIDEGGNERTQLYLDGEPLVVDPRFIHRFPAVSRDGSLLAYSTNRRNGIDFDIVVRSLESGEERIFELDGLWANGDFSPDSRRLVAIRRGESSGDDDLFLLRVESGEVVHITPHYGAAEYLTPVWSADGSFLYAATNEERDTFAIARYDVAANAWETVKSRSGTCPASATREGGACSWPRTRTATRGSRAFRCRRTGSRITSCSRRTGAASPSGSRQRRSLIKSGSTTSAPARRGS